MVKSESQWKSQNASTMREDENAIPDAIITRPRLDVHFRINIFSARMCRWYTLCAGISRWKTSIIGFQIIRRPVLHADVACARESSVFLNTRIKFRDRIVEYLDVHLCLFLSFAKNRKISVMLLIASGLRQHNYPHYIFALQHNVIKINK